MSTFGCHSCKIKIEDYLDKPWEERPCANCPMARNYTRTFNTGFFDTGKDDDEETGEGKEEKYRFKREHEFITSGKYPLREEEIQTLETIKKAVEQQIYMMFSGLLVRLLHMAKTNPVMFEVLIKKMQFPTMSYSDIGSTMDPKCSKQNVLYHLKNAVEEFPELESVIQTDTRYTAGHYVLRTIAEKKRREEAMGRIRSNLYGQVRQTCKPMDIDQLNQILKAPFMVRDEVFLFNAYTADEDHIKNGKTAAEN